MAEAGRADAYEARPGSCYRKPIASASRLIIQTDRSKYLSRSVEVPWYRARGQFAIA